MGMYHHILVATDLTDASKPTVKKAWELASQFESKLSIVHVIEPIPVYGYPGLPAMQSQLADEVRQELAKFSKEFSIAESQQFLEVGPPKTEVLRIAEELKADLIVVGSHGRHGILQLLGSTANAIVHGANCDVLTIRVEEPV